MLRGQRVELALRGLHLRLEHVALRDRTDLEQRAHATLVVASEPQRLAVHPCQVKGLNHGVELAAHRERHVVAGRRL